LPRKPQDTGSAYLAFHSSLEFSFGGKKN